MMPVAYVLSALLSTWVLASARRRFQLHFAFGLAVGTLFLTSIFFPIYLALMLWWKKDGRPQRWRYALPLLYATIALVGIIGYFYLEKN
jgi:hypothetical protein